MRALAREAPKLRCELVEAEPEEALPALALGDFDLVLADEWQHQPLRRPAGVDRHDLHREPVRLVLPEDHPAARRHEGAVPLRELADEVWTTGHPGTPWEEMTERTCRQLGGFDPTIRHRANDSVLSLALVAQGLAVTLLPDLVAPAAQPGVVVRTIAEGPVYRTIFAATRAADAERPSVRALLAAVRTAARWRSPVAHVDSASTRQASPRTRTSASSRPTSARATTTDGGHRFEFDDDRDEGDLSQALDAVAPTGGTTSRWASSSTPAFSGR